MKCQHFTCHQCIDAEVVQLRSALEDANERAEKAEFSLKASESLNTNLQKRYHDLETVVDVKIGELKAQISVLKSEKDAAERRAKSESESDAESIAMYRRARDRAEKHAEQRNKAFALLAQCLEQNLPVDLSEIIKTTLREDI